MNSYPADKFIAGLLLSGFVSMVFTAAFAYFDNSLGRHMTGLAWVAIPTLAAACLTIIRPLMHKTILRSRRDVFLLDEDLNALLWGRAIGLVCGLVAAGALLADLR